MPNTQLRQHIDDMPGILAKLERIPEITTRLDLIDTLRAHALSLEPLDGVETMALSDYDRDWLVRYTYNPPVCWRGNWVSACRGVRSRPCGGVSGRAWRRPCRRTRRRRG